MILQVIKFLPKKKDFLRTDLIDGVKRVCHVEDFVQVHFYDGSCNSFSVGGIDPIGEVAEEWDSYLVDSLYLLNDNGKTLRKLL